ncbi:hypothetical protein EGY31_11080 [Burkholderia multivorans]|uniref:hypothetical protein n=1 Tax=Burkholderia ubonensis TaxID=101571 RepID=UPI000F71D9EB|nr:hypothetical protein [Burkholderia ubonensis]AYZ63700.1 hypothetical protein EGY31_11080 [Burkholderia multivorans]VWC26578.1 type IV secretion protein Rhs [Burkholderia ubonensis]
MSKTGKQRTHKVGTQTLRVNRVQPTTLGRMPLYAICTPDRWGLRYSDEDPDRHDQLMYPVARDYVRAIQNVLVTQVQWGDAYFGPAGATPVLKLHWPLDGKGQTDRLADLVRPIITAALTSPTAGFGIPEHGVPIQLGLYAPSPNNPPGEQGAFRPNDWSLLLSVSELAPMFRIRKAEPPSNMADRRQQLDPLKVFADTLYHEARHCQQWFWIFALVQQHPDNFETIPNIAKWPSVLSNSYSTHNTSEGKSQAQSIVELTAKHRIPNDTATLISLKRMAIGQYVYTLNVWRRLKYRPPYLAHATAMESEYQRAHAAATDLLQHVGIGGTPIDVDAMVAEPNTCYCDYTARPWENDAFFCGEMATAYWGAELGLALKTYQVDQCSRAYELADAHHKLAVRVAGDRTGAEDADGGH